MPAHPKSRSLLFRISAFFGHFRWLFMPLGLCALLAVGVHAAADVIDDRVLRWVDWLDALLDGVFAAWSVTQPLVNWVAPEQCRLIARALTLALELLTDGALALPALGYRETTVRPPSLRALVQSALERPTTIRLVRPLMTATVALAGACAVARMVEGELYLRLGQLSPGDIARAWSKLGALAALALVLATFGWRAVLRSLQHADRFSDRKLSPVARLSEELVRELSLTTGTRHRIQAAARAVGTGLVGTAIAAPIAIAALLEASPVLSFFR